MRNRCNGGVREEIFQAPENVQTPLTKNIFPYKEQRGMSYKKGPKEYMEFNTPSDPKTANSVSQDDVIVKGKRTNKTSTVNDLVERGKSTLESSLWPARSGKLNDRDKKSPPLEKGREIIKK